MDSAPTIARYAESGAPKSPLLRALMRTADRLERVFLDEIMVALREEIARARRQGFHEGYRKGQQDRFRPVRR
jgi:flagellar biosynthesis/type III secretory pathway protein FliH